MLAKNIRISKLVPNRQLKRKLLINRRTKREKMAERSRKELEKIRRQGYALYD
jgi:hypothetical protein